MRSIETFVPSIFVRAISGADFGDVFVRIFVEILFAIFAAKLPETTQDIALSLSHIDTDLEKLGPTDESGDHQLGEVALIVDTVNG